MNGALLMYISVDTVYQMLLSVRVKERESKMHPCTGTEALYRPYGP